MVFCDSDGVVMARNTQRSTWPRVLAQSHTPEVHDVPLSASSEIFAVVVPINQSIEAL